MCSREKLIPAARARETWRAQLSGPKAGEKASGGLEHQGVGPGARAVGDDQRGSGGAAQVGIQLGRVEQRAVDGQHHDAVGAAAHGGAGARLGGEGVPAIALLAQHVVAEPAGVAGHRVVGGDDDRLVDVVAFRILQEQVEEHLLRQARALGGGQQRPRAGCGPSRGA